MDISFLKVALRHFLLRAHLESFLFASEFITGLFLDIKLLAVILLQVLFVFLLFE